MDAFADRTRGGVAAATAEIEKLNEAGPEDMESDPAAAREKEQVQPWREQVTLRGMVAALLIGFLFTIIVMKIALTTGQIPTLNVSAALIAFLALRGWTRALERLGVAYRPFTRQENCVIETCAVACYTKHHRVRRWVRLHAAGNGQEDVRAGRELGGQPAGELQGPWIRLDGRIHGGDQLLGPPQLDSP